MRKSHSLGIFNRKEIVVHLTIQTSIKSLLQDENNNYFLRFEITTFNYLLPKGTM